MTPQVQTTQCECESASGPNLGSSKVTFTFELSEKEAKAVAKIQRTHDKILARNYKVRICLKRFEGKRAARYFVREGRLELYTSILRQVYEMPVPKLIEDLKTTPRTWNCDENLVTRDYWAETEWRNKGIVKATKRCVKLLTKALQP